MDAQQTHNQNPNKEFTVNSNPIEHAKKTFKQYRKRLFVVFLVYAVIMIIVFAGFFWYALPYFLSNKH